MASWVVLMPARFHAVPALIKALLPRQEALLPATCWEWGLPSAKRFRETSLSLRNELTETTALPPSPSPEQPAFFLTPYFFIHPQLYILGKPEFICLSWGDLTPALIPFPHAELIIKFRANKAFPRPAGPRVGPLSPVGGDGDGWHVENGAAVPCGCRPQLGAQLISILGLQQKDLHFT